VNVGAASTISGFIVGIEKPIAVTAAAFQVVSRKLLRSIFLEFKSFNHFSIFNIILSL
jgi:hypothetical protein